MMTRAAVCLLLLGFSLPSLAQNGSDQEAEQTRILALENAWNRAEQNKDAQALDGLLADSLVYIDYDGSLMDKSQFMASVKQPSLHPQQIVNETMTAHIYGNSAIVTGVYREKGTNKGKPYLRRGRFTDTWVSLNGKWACVASQSTLMSH
jgi:ketosteroid isomerase-like protein